MAMHSRAEIVAHINALSDKDIADGVYVDVPKKRRRQQAMGVKQIRVNVPKDLQRRFATQINRYVEILGKDLAWETMCMLLEGPKDELIRNVGETEGREEPHAAPLQN